MKIVFDKYQATGNDFILMDNRDNLYSNLTKEQVAFLCDRRFGIGGDGLMLLNNKEGFDFEMKYFNADGNPGSMCGNGGRCIVQFANECGIKKEKYSFLAYDGSHVAERNGDKVSLLMNDVHEVKNNNEAFVLDTGSPHYISFVNDVEIINVSQIGRSIRNSDTFRDKGINVNFVQTLGENEIFVRTYERGVEDETLSCGTGVTASAIAVSVGKSGQNEIFVRTNGGELSVSLKNNGGHFTDIWLTGPARHVFSGEINLKIDV